MKQRILAILATASTLLLLSNSTLADSYYTCPPVETLTIQPNGLVFGPNGWYGNSYFSADELKDNKWRTEIDSVIYTQPLNFAHDGWALSCQYFKANSQSGYGELQLRMPLPNSHDEMTPYHLYESSSSTKMGDCAGEYPGVNNKCYWSIEPHTD